MYILMKVDRFGQKTYPAKSLDYSFVYSHAERLLEGVRILKTTKKGWITKDFSIFIIER